MKKEVTMRDIQRLFDYYIERIEKQAALVSIEEAAGKYCTFESGALLAYQSIARQLVNLGAEAKKKRSKKNEVESKT